MSVQELEQAVVQLPSPELAQFAAWFEAYQADLWDQQIEQNALAGRFDALTEQANQEFEAGRCKRYHGMNMKNTWGKPQGITFRAWPCRSSRTKSED